LNSSVTHISQLLCQPILGRGIAITKKVAFIATFFYVPYQSSTRYLNRSARLMIRQIERMIQGGGALYVAGLIHHKLQEGK
ncbi:hypothetical protein, partial [Cnuella takakiae]